MNSVSSVVTQDGPHCITTRFDGVKNSIIMILIREEEISLADARSRRQRRAAVLAPLAAPGQRQPNGQLCHRGADSVRAKGEPPQPYQFGCFLYHRLAELVSPWTEHPASPPVRALMMHSVFLPLPLPTVHHFCAW